MEAGFPGVKAVAAPTARSVIKVLRGAMVFNCSTKWAKEVLIELGRREEREMDGEKEKRARAPSSFSHIGHPDLSELNNEDTPLTRSTKCIVCASVRKPTAKNLACARRSQASSIHLSLCFCYFSLADSINLNYIPIN